MIPKCYIETQYSATRGASSHLIAWWGFGWDGYSHTDAVLPDGDLLGSRWDNPGGHGKGVRIRPPNYEVWSRVSRVKIPVSMKEQKDWLDFLHSVVGDQYDPANIRRLIFGEKQVNLPKHYICSALQTCASYIAGVFPIAVKDISHQITPDTHRLMSLVVPGAQLQTIIP